MFRDSYLNFIGSHIEDDSIETATPRRGDVEYLSHVGCYMEVASIHAEDGNRWGREGDAGHLARDRAKTIRERDLRRKHRGDRESNSDR